MAQKETTLNELADMLARVVEHMATKDDLLVLRTELKSDIAAVRVELVATLGVQIASIENDLKEIKRDLSKLADQVDNITGYRKEIDHALERIAALERHLGIHNKLAA